MTTHIPLRTAFSTMVQDGYDSTIVLLDTGNYPSYSSYLNQTWTFASGDWTNHSTALIDAAGPLPGRSQQMMAYDGYQVMLFGGKGAATGQLFEDTWTWVGGATNAWTKQSPVTSPFGRYGAQATYLANSAGSAVAVMFGGCGGSGSGVLLNETWVWNGHLLTWTLLPITSAASPAARSGHVFAANTTDGYLFGGQGTNSQFNDTWAFTYSGGVGTWTSVAAVGSPSVRSGACMAYDSTNSVFVMFGGENEYNYLNETWTFTPATATWAKTAIANGVGPAGRVGAQMAWDVGSSRIIMYGGISAGTNYPSNETWSYNSLSGVWTQL